MSALPCRICDEAEKQRATDPPDIAVPPCACGHSGWCHYLLRGECDHRAVCGCQGFVAAVLA